VKTSMSNAQTLTPTLAAAQTQSGITEISVGGFKSIATKQSIEIRPLTILAGANSSGKSSFMQPLLLLKQTLEAQFNPGALLLSGPNAKFASGQQILAQSASTEFTDGFEVTIRGDGGLGAKVVFRYRHDRGFDVRETETRLGGGRVISLRPEMSSEEIAAAVADPRVPAGAQWSLFPDRFLLLPEYCSDARQFKAPSRPLPVQAPIVAWVTRLIHVPGLRGISERGYPTTAVGLTFPGTFENYVASVIYNWQTAGAEAHLKLNDHLGNIGLTRRVEAKRINDALIELHVDRLPPASSSEEDLADIADVGFGVPTVLPVIVALIAAQPEQAVYIEQPELHLHPRAQVRLADVLADAARRGVRVIAETHSSLLIRAIQTLVAKGELDANLVKLHWFSRSEKDGATTVTSADLDENGAFGDWPMDFDEVEFRSTGDYLDAVELRSK
jgi:AAA domain, putative AbiEii toxin, Type IV TA system/AAA ATPase domain